MERNRYPLDKKRNPITEGFLLSVEEYYDFLKHPSLSRLYDDCESVLCIYAIYPKLSRITCYPGNFTAVFKIHIEFPKEGLKSYQLKSQPLKSYTVVHTTGLSEKNDMYSVEYYFKGSDEPFQWENFVKLIDRINEGSNFIYCEGELIEFQDHHKNG